LTQISYTLVSNQVVKYFFVHVLLLKYFRNFFVFRMTFGLPIIMTQYDTYKIWSKRLIRLDNIPQSIPSLSAFRQMILVQFPIWLTLILVFSINLFDYFRFMESLIIIIIVIGIALTSCDIVFDLFSRHHSHHVLEKLLIASLLLPFAFLFLRMSLLPLLLLLLLFLFLLF